MADLEAVNRMLYKYDHQAGYGVREFHAELSALPATPEEIQRTIDSARAGLAVLRQLEEFGLIPPRVPTELEELRTLVAALREKLAEADAERLIHDATRLELQQADELVAELRRELAEEVERRQAATAHLDRVGIALGREIHHAADNGHRLDRDCQGVAPGEHVPAVRVSSIQAAMEGAARGKPSPGTVHRIGDAMVQGLSDGIDSVQAVLNTRTTGLTCANCGRPILAWPPSSPAGFRHLRGAELYCNPRAAYAITDTPPDTRTATPTEKES